MPVAYSSQLFAVAYGATQQAGLGGHVIRSKKLQDIAVKVVPARKS